MFLPGVLPVLLQAPIDISVSHGMVDFKVSQWMFWLLGKTSCITAVFNYHL